MPRLIDRARRERELAEAVWRVVLRDGVPAVSVRTVAAEAGLSAGSLRHVFATQAELLEVALELIHETVRERVLGIPVEITGLDRALRIAAELLPLDPTRAAELQVQLSLSTLAFTQEKLRRVRDEADLAVRAGCRQMIEHATSPASPPAARLDRETQALHALLDGLAVHLLRGPHLVSPEAALTVVREHLHRLSPVSASSGETPQ
ncbi:TetR/AcrR family transcriptional regulator [Dietzia sp. PP-33]|uniref:TetR/AcrR family transcriptional regulator n=1 Tax=Dietzia sp. PP-33 TaxID=2957500 RepID=UPI0029B74E77|nr:TetR family transcriptional regulator C-terminal domain-containing protein [Dietzia sp. PP-33]MDX2358732.1 TetR family transcriptional regulator C-terminal domain-containing protein [Dietzia sp. PP-33]